MCDTNPSPGIPHLLPQLPPLMFLHLLPPNDNQPRSLNLILLDSWQTNLILPPLFVQQWENGPRVHNRYVRYRVLFYPIRFTPINNFNTNTPWCK